MQCPHCKRYVDIPTLEEIAAFTLVVLQHKTQEEAGRILSISHQAVGLRLANVARRSPKAMRWIDLGSNCDSKSQ